MSGDFSEGITGDRSRARTIATAIGVVAIAAAGVIAATTLLPASQSPKADSSTSPSPSVTATPLPASDATAPGALEESEAATIVDAVLSVPLALESIGTESDLDALLRDIAADSYAAELHATWQEYLTNGWTVKGTPTVESAEVTSLDDAARPATAEVTACIDSTDVTIVDAAGNPVGDQSARAPRALHLFSLIQSEDGTWRITAHSFPNDPKC
ncbi:MAG: hypothetical protein QM630_07195 [Microbacterium sp.]